MKAWERERRLLERLQEQGSLALTEACALTGASVATTRRDFELLQEKGLERSRVVRMADLNETFGYQIFTGARHPSRNKVLQIAFAMALTLKEANRALTAAGANVLNCKDRRDAIIIFCIDRGCSLQKVNEELYRFGEETVS